MGAMRVMYVFLRAMLLPKARLAMENLALRQQLAVCRQSINRFNIHRSLCVSCACRSVGICVLVSLLIAARETQAESFASQFIAPEDITVELYADESQVADPVAICLDDQGRVYVAETARALRGVEENRRGDEWLNDDLALQKVEDRLAMYRKWADHFDGGMDYFSKYADQLRRLEDTDADGRADRSTIFAGGFNHPLDGLAAGVIARQGDVYFTCIPSLYLLRDDNNDGHADGRNVLHHGFGIRHAFYGHDLHGLVWGPDGKLYFSMGDRGFHVQTPAGQTLHSPDRGAVLRCNPDGSELEVVATGLRNPQELAFDRYGNLFTGDNNSDAGDSARLVYLPEGSDSGWRMTFQYMDDPYLRGPWTEEKIWYPQHEGQPAWILPPIAWIGSGPSGLTYYPGIGLPERYQQHFFLCDFHANQTSTVDAFAVEPKGAGFGMVNHHHFLNHICATDVDFGYDGKMYVADFIEGWEPSGSGRIITVHAPEHCRRPEVAQITRLFAKGFQQRSISELVDLLAHEDMRVRLRAQFALAERQAEAIDPLRRVASGSKHRLARLHAIWGLGQIGIADSRAVSDLVSLLSDDDVEVRANAAKVLGDCRYAPGAQPLVGCLGDDSLRVRAKAAQALGKIGTRPSIDPLLAVLEENGDKDVFLRHAVVMGLSRIGDADALLVHANHPSRSVRLGILLVLRRLDDARVVRFLDDPDPFLATEAARAIHDLPLTEALPQLAAVIERFSPSNQEQPPVPGHTADEPTEPDASWALKRRVLNANFRLGKAEHAAGLTRFLANAAQPRVLRSLALQLLEQWTDPPARDVVLGHLQHLPARDSKRLAEVLQPLISELLNNTRGDLRAGATRLASSLGIEVDTESFVRWLRDEKSPTTTRVEALRFLAAQNHEDLAHLIGEAVNDNDPYLRSEARDVLAQIDVQRAIKSLKTALADGVPSE